VRTAFNDLKHHSETLDELKIFLKEKKKRACAKKKKKREGSEIIVPTFAIELY